MADMHMTDSEIIHRYRRSESPNAGIKILAQLNMCDTVDIARILHNHGETIPATMGEKLGLVDIVVDNKQHSITTNSVKIKWTKDILASVCRFMLQGMTTKEISAELGTKYNNVVNACTRYQITRNTAKQWLESNGYVTESDSNVPEVTTITTKSKSDVTASDIRDLKILANEAKRANSPTSAAFLLGRLYQLIEDLDKKVNIDGS